MGIPARSSSDLVARAHDLLYESPAHHSLHTHASSYCRLFRDQMDAAMKAHAGGGVTPHPTTTKPPTSPSETASSPTSAGGRIGGRQPTSAAVKKGFLDSGAGGGCLYGKEGSREGGSVRGGSGRTSRADRKFEQLVALADPDMGDVGDGASKVRPPHCCLCWCSSTFGSSTLCL